MSNSDAIRFVDWVADNRRSWPGEALNLGGTVAPVSSLHLAIQYYFGSPREDIAEAALTIRDFQEWQARYRLFFFADDWSHNRSVVAILSNDDVLAEYIDMHPQAQQHRDLLAHYLVKRNPGQLLFLERVLQRRESGRMHPVK
jgi:hypothetical protein